ncbi:MAG: replicative DNA helicase [Chloroflexi bacterium]|nr:replicative DNA helicase [Chloroflexota bacterium]
MVYTEQLPPHNDEAEEGILGSLLIDNDATPRVSAFLQPTDFFRQKHAWVYEACVSLMARNDPVNQISVADELARRQRLDDTGGLPFLSHLIATVPTSVYAENYAQVVRRLSIMRQLIVAGGRIADIGYRAEADEDEALKQAEDFVYKIRMGQTERDLVPLKVALDRFLEEGVHASTPHQGVSTGFMDLDRLLGGLQPSDLLVLAARPGVGKSAIALNIARTVAGQRRPDGRRRVAAFFSLEMATEQVVERLLASESGVNSRRLREGNWTDREEALIMRAVGELAELPLYIDDSPMLSVVEMRSKARRLHLEEGLDLVIVDYLQMMEGRRSFGGNRVQEISEISRSLKALARDLTVPMLALSQLSRAVEQRPDHEPQLSDLRESGAIEQDADVVVFLYRADHYFNEEEWERRRPGEEYPRGIADLIIAKHRNGPLGRLQLVFRESTTTFMDLYRSNGSGISSML